MATVQRNELGPDQLRPSVQDGSAASAEAQDSLSRKRFFRNIGSGGALAAMSVLLVACGDDEKSGSATNPMTTETTKTDATGDIEIVNYALTLEYVEADFYQQVIDSGVIKDKKIGELAKTLGEQEQEHVDALKATVEKLGGTAVEAPKTDFEATLAGGAKKILETAATVENLGAAAYLGQAGRIKDKEILAAALAIHSVEARHAAALNQLVGRGFKGDGPLSGSVPDGAFASPLSMDEVLAQVKPFLAA